MVSRRSAGLIAFGLVVLALGMGGSILWRHEAAAPIIGIVRIDQLGASLWEVAHDWRGLWLLAVAYFALAVLSAFLVKRSRRHG